ncbi:MAG: hypothetical protein CM15mP115_02230 [Alphaproteobacteria bacterium]|nr:MAG: hypothetical protein CM15mP115_02230 [Alphaproteobacteria bacterium]
MRRTTHRQAGRCVVELCKARRIIACAFEQQVGAGIIVGLQFCFGKGAAGRFQAAPATLGQFRNGAQGLQSRCHIRCNSRLNVMGPIFGVRISRRQASFSLRSIQPV